MLFHLRYAIRSLAKSPAYTAIALATLALGIGVNTSMFSIVDALLFRPAPYPDADRLVEVRSVTHNGPLIRYSEQELRELKPQAPGFAAVTAYDRMLYSVAEPGQPPERLLGI